MGKVFRNRGAFLTDGLREMYRTIPNVTEKTGIEIGCCGGESSVIAAIFLKKVYCIDIWDKTYFGVAEGDYGPEEQFDILAKWYNNITKLKGASREFAATFDDASIDVLYLDGHDSRDGMREDVSLYLPKIKIGGYICGHDYDIRYPMVEDMLPAVKKRFVDESWLCVNE